jgi:hypothetical protein
LETPGRSEPRGEEEAGEVVMQQQEELEGQKEELGRPAMGDEWDLVAVDGTDNPKDKEAT